MVLTLVIWSPLMMILTVLAMVMMFIVVIIRMFPVMVVISWMGKLVMSSATKISRKKVSQ